MVVYQWIERLLGQTIAPDDQYDPELQDQFVPSIFDTLAPDPNFPPLASAVSSSSTTASTSPSPYPPIRKLNQPPPPSVFQHTPSSSSKNLVVCQTCGHWTPKEALSMSSISSPSKPVSSETITPNHSNISTANNNNNNNSSPETPAPATSTTFSTPKASSHRTNRTPTRRTPRRTPKMLGTTPASISKNSTNAKQTARSPYISSSSSSSTSRLLLLSPELQQRLAEAAAQTAEWKSMHASSNRRHSFEIADAFLGKLLVATNSRQAQQGAVGYVQEMERMIQQHPWLLTDVRTTSRTVTGASCPEGYTPLMAAVWIGHMPAVRLFLQYIHHLDVLLKVNLQGQQATHLACLQGHDQILHLLQDANERLLGTAELLSPDIFGQTPLATAFGSPNPKAANCQQELLRQPWTRKDKSVFGDTSLAADDEAEEFSSLSQDKHTDSLSDRVGYDLALHIQSGHAEMPGRRGYMEDAILINYFEPETPGAVFGVLDGHDDAGYVAQYVADRIEQEVLRLLSLSLSSLASTLPLDLETAFLQIDDELKDQMELKGGSTAVVAVVTKDDIIVANVGDSRCILVQQTPATTAALESKKSTSGTNMDALTDQMSRLHTDDVTVIALSQDHKPDLEQERSRIEKLANMHVREIAFEKEGKQMVVHKVVKTKKNGDTISEMGMSRSFGDHEFKKKKDVKASEQAITAVPEIVVRPRANDRDSFLILACDGIWDVMSNDEVGRFVTNHVFRLLTEKGDPQSVLPAVADLLLQECFRLGSNDNMSVVIVAFGATAETVGSAAGIRIASSTSLGGKALDFAGAERSEKAT